MERKQENLPAVKGTQNDALEMVKRYKSENQLVFVAEEDLKTHTMFLPEVVVIRSTPDDFHNISGNFQPKGHQIDRIGEAAGISFLTSNCGTRTETVDGNTVYVGFAQARKRLPDGTWRISSICEYEFNPVKRAEEDVLKDSKGKYGNEKERKLLLLTYQKFGRQRADTGARLRVIHELTGMPISFKPQEIAKAMIFCRVSVNTDALLADPEMREAAIRIATGASEQLYGPSKEQKYITGGQGEEANYEVKNGTPAGGPENNEVAVPWETEQKEQESEEEAAAESKNRGMVEELRAGREKLDKVLPPDAKSMIDDILKQEKPKPSSVSAMIDKLNSWEARYLERKGARS
jgi:hypothetical protein